MLAIVTTVGSSSIPGWSGSYGIEVFLAWRSFREDSGDAPVSVPSSGSGVDPGLRAGSEVEALRETLFLGVPFPFTDCWERRTLLEGGLAVLESGSTMDARRFLKEVDGEEGPGGGVCKPWERSLSAVCRGINARRWDSVDEWIPVEREGTEMGVGVSEGGVGIDEERDPMLIGVAGFLEDPTAMGVETLVETMLGIARWGSTEDRRACESSVSCCSEASDSVGVSSRCGTEEGGGIVFGVSLECKGAEPEGPDFGAESGAGRRCLETGLNNVPPFSGSPLRQRIARLSEESTLTDARRHDDEVYQPKTAVDPKSITRSPSSLEPISAAASWQTSGCQRSRNLQMTLDNKYFALSLIGRPVSRPETTLTDTGYSQSRCTAIFEAMSVVPG